jgi:hypothetical protein
MYETNEYMPIRDCSYVYNKTYNGEDQCLIINMLPYRYESSPLPQRGNIFNYWITVSKPVFRKMLFPTLLQTVFASYLGSRQYKLLIKALQLPEPDLEIH